MKLSWGGLLGFSLIALGTPGQTPRVTWTSSPYRALLVVERWSDPTSVLVDHERDEFQPVAALLKAWSVPFDIFRLDQQHLDSSYLFDRTGSPRYGVVVWLADSSSYKDQNLTSLEQAAHAGTSLLVVRSRFLDPALERLLGLKFKEAYRAPDPLRVTHPHFITRELAAQKMDSLEIYEESWTGPWVEPKGAEVLISQGQHPLLTVNVLRDGNSAIWMAPPRLKDLRDSDYWRGLFFRALVWNLGYVVRPNMDYAHRIEIEIDDWGTSDKGFLSYWRYLEPGEETLRDHLIAPLQNRHATVSANVITGYVDRKTGRILSPWTQEFTDLYGLHQNYASAQRGLKAAVAAGVLEIQSHGWTHMLPDLDSSPGPWWTADLGGEASAGGWYTEFADERRGIEVPAIVQLFHIQRSFEYLKADFAQRPLELRPGGGAWSKSYANQTALIAAKGGFGIFQAEPDFYYYLDRDLVLDMTGISPHLTIAFDHPLRPDLWPPHPDGPFMIVFHDRDIAYQPEFIERLLTAMAGRYETVSTNQYVGFLHARIESAANEGWQLKFLYDEPYCAYFAGHPSSWRVWFSDPMRGKFKSLQNLVITVDGKIVRAGKASDLMDESLTIEIPPGMGEHVWGLSRAR